MVYNLLLSVETSNSQQQFSHMIVYIHINFLNTTYLHSQMSSKHSVNVALQSKKIMSDNIFQLEFNVG